MSKDVTRLYDQFQPEHYSLSITPDPVTMKFHGSVIVKGKKVGRPSKRITFHQKELKINSAQIVRQDKKGEQEQKLVRINNQNSFDVVRLHTEQMLFPGQYEIIMEFSGTITQAMNGIYPCFFKQGGVDKKLIATQFESHYAREAFPCIDEPEAKAVFDLRLSTPPGDTVVSNTPIKSQQDEDGLLVTTFEPTPKMSTYLLAFVFGEMKFKEAKTKDGVLVRCYATPDNVEYTDYALDCAVRTLEFYNDYFDIPYPLAKCDFIAVPDFANGAMENWGCITFREQALLVDPKNTSLHLKQYVANVIAHELTHQWFGNLVTMRWWTDLWLNESFASWMSWLAVDALFPEWNVWTQFIVEEQGIALKADALEHTHPIEVPIHHPDEIRTAFDVISYEKGASVLLMLHKYLGPTDFRDGLRKYLKAHAYGNTDTIDLWNALGDVSKKPVAKFMSAWTATSGYPIVQAMIATDNPQLTQERFYLNPGADKKEQTWPIPLLASEDIGLLTLDKARQSIHPKQVSGTFVLNSGRSSLFRTMYDAKHLSSLGEAVRAGALSEVDRLGLLGDAFEAAKAGYGSTIDAFDLLASFADEDSTVVWDVIGGSIGSVRLVMDDEQLRSGLKPFVRSLVTKQLQRLGWEEKPSDSHFDRLLRPTILGMASYAEEPTVVSEALERFKKMKKPEDVHPDIRGVVYATAARNGNVEDFEKMRRMHNDSKSGEERVTLAGSLTGFQQPELIEKALEMMISPEVRRQDISYWIAYTFMNRHGRAQSWKWFTAHWDWFSENLGSDPSFIRLPNYIGRSFSDEHFLVDFKKFFAAHTTPANSRPIQQAIETISWQAAWKKRDLADLQRYFSR